MTVADLTLTKRQREVVQLLLSGKSVTEIAAKLRCSEWTVRSTSTMIATDLPARTAMRRILIYGAALLGD
jgi:DNA-binding NarL/FixJ family response regulator